MSGGEQLITEVITNQDRDMSVTMFTAPQVWPPVLSLHCCQCQWSHPGGWGQWQGDNHSDTRRGELRPGAGEPWPIRGLESSWPMCVFQVPGQWAHSKSKLEEEADCWRGQGHLRRGPAEWHYWHRDHPGPGPTHQEAHALEGDGVEKLFFLLGLVLSSKDISTNYNEDLIPRLESLNLEIFLLVWCLLTECPVNSKGLAPIGF